MGKAFNFGPFWENATDVEVLSRAWKKNVSGSVTYNLNTKSAQSTASENIGPKRTLLAPTAIGAVLSPSRITLENNGKIRPQPDREKLLSGASGGAVRRMRTRLCLRKCAVY